MTLCGILSSPAFTHAYAMAGGFAINWVLSFIKHAPPPFRDHVWRGAAFDATQDTAKNNERIGQRRGSDSTFATVTDADGKSATSQSVTAAPPHGAVAVTIPNGQAAQKVTP